MQLSRIDLNLFTVFAAIYQEGGITPASRRLHLSQPAVSHALARLRELLHDPLFERQGNRMVPTPRARAIAGSVGQSLSGLEHVLEGASDIDTALTPRNFVIAVRESYEAALLSPLMERVRREAPHASLSLVRIERNDVEQDLQSGDLDAVIDVALPLAPEIRRERLSSHPLMVVVRAGHPQISGTLDLATYLEHEHILVTGRRRGSGYEDLVLGQLGLSRHIKIRCQHHAAACALVSRCDLLLTLPRHQAALANQHLHNQLLPFPTQALPMEMYLYWHANVAAEPASQWLRRTIVAVMREAMGAEELAPPSQSA
jgi:DNA-binding transcriptional LysR family regulator